MLPSVAQELATLAKMKPVDGALKVTKIWTALTRMMVMNMEKTARQSGFHLWRKSSSLVLKIERYVFSYFNTSSLVHNPYLQSNKRVYGLYS